MNDLAAKSTNAEYRVLRSSLVQALKYGVTAQVLASNPMLAIENPRLKPQPDAVSLNVHQLQVVRQAFAEYVAAGKRYSNRRNSQLTVDIILELGGLRIAEALAIRHCDIDWDNCVADVIGTLIYTPGQPIWRQGELKYARQERFVQLSPDGIGMRALRAAREECPHSAAAPKTRLSAESSQLQPHG